MSLHAEDMSVSSSEDSASSQSSVTPHSLKRTHAEEVQEKLKRALEVLHLFPLPIGTHNRVQNKKNQNVDWKEHFCARAWNETSEQLDGVTRRILFESKYEPDSVLGGKRYIKQEFEYLMIEKWVKIVMDAYVEDKKEQFCISFAEKQIVAANARWNEYFCAYDNYDSSISRIVKNVRTVFLTEKIFKHTIKGKENQSIPVLQDFFQNPSIQTFETLAKYHWRCHIKRRRDRKKRIWEEIDSAVLNGEEYLPEFDTAIKWKRAHHSEEEKRRVKDKTHCKCVGLPIGFPTCVNFDKVLAYGQLIHEHRNPVAVFCDESDENRWGMCPDCSNYKTRYIDRHVINHKDDTDLIQNYKYNYILPEAIMQQIFLQVRLDTPELIQPCFDLIIKHPS